MPSMSTRSQYPLFSKEVQTFEPWRQASRHWRLPLSNILHELFPTKVSLLPDHSLDCEQVCRVAVVQSQLEQKRHILQCYTSQVVNSVCLQIFPPAHQTLNRKVHRRDKSFQIQAFRLGKLRNQKTCLA